MAGRMRRTKLLAVNACLLGEKCRVNRRRAEGSWLCDDARSGTLCRGHPALRLTLPPHCPPWLTPEGKLAASKAAAPGSPWPRPCASRDGPLGLLASRVCAHAQEEDNVP